jgi:hypothetical protein
MKRYWQKLMILISVLTLSLAGLFGTCITANAVAVGDSYVPTDVFTCSKVTCVTDAGDYPIYKLYNLSSLTYKQDLALAWSEGGNARYFNLDLEFSEIKFDTLTITLQTESYTKTEDENVADNKRYVEYVC